MKIRQMLEALSVWVRLSFLCSFLLTFSSFANAQLNLASYESPADIPVSVFGSSPTISQINLSFSGEEYAAIVPAGNGFFVVINPVGNGIDNPINKFEVTDAIPEWFQWISPEKLLISYQIVDADSTNSQALSITRNLAVYSIENNSFTPLRKNKISLVQSRGSDKLLDVVYEDSSYVLISAFEKSSAFPRVERINTLTGELQIMIPPRPPITQWFSDASGQIRLGTGYLDNSPTVITRLNEQEEWIELNESPLFRDGRFAPTGFTVDADILYVKSSIPNGRNSIFRWSIAENRIIDKVFEHPEVDVEDIIHFPQKPNAVAAIYIDDKPEYKILDPDFGEDIQALNQLLPDTANMVTDFSRDGRYFLVFAFSPRSPGTYYRFDTEELSLELLVENYPLIPQNLLSEMKSISYFARDGIEIPGYLTLPKNSDGKNLPTIVMPHGGPWVRDILSYDYISQFLASRGYAVLQPNFRGSTGYGLIFEYMGNGQWGKSMQTDLSDGLAWLVKQGITDPKNVCIVGGSYGGYASLIGASDKPQLYQCAIAIAPVSDVQAYLNGFKDEPASQDTVSTKVNADMTKEELDKISPIMRVRAMSVPILLLHGEADLTVPVEQSIKFAEQMKKRRKKIEFIIQEKGTHQLNAEGQEIETLTLIEDFLQKHLPTK